MQQILQIKQGYKTPGISIGRGAIIDKGASFTCGSSRIGTGIQHYQGIVVSILEDATIHKKAKITIGDISVGNGPSFRNK